MKSFFYIFVLFFILSCDDVINQPESSKYGAIRLTFNKPSDELTETINNNRSMSQFADIDAVRITINNSSPVTVSIIGGSASYSKSGLSVGTASIKVELTGAGITKYTQTKSVTIIENQTASTSFNAFAITNQSISLTSSFQSTYDGGDIINLSWTNSHAEQPVNIERWDQVGGTWVKTKTVEDNFVGTSYSWNTQGESSGENVKVRIQSTISNSFIDSQTFQLISTEVLLELDYGEYLEFTDALVSSDNHIILSGFTYDGNVNAPVIAKTDFNGNIIAFSERSTSSNLRYISSVEFNNFIYSVSVNTNNSIVVDKWNLSLTSMDSYTTSVNYSCSSNCRPVEVGDIERYTTPGGSTDALIIPYSNDIDGYNGTYGYNAGVLSLIVASDGSLSFGYSGLWNYEEDDFAFGVISNGNSFVLTRFNENYTSSLSNQLLLRFETSYDPYNGPNSSVFGFYDTDAAAYWFEFLNLNSSAKSDIYQSTTSLELINNIIVPLYTDFSAFGNYFSDENTYYYTSYVNPYDNSYALAGRKNLDNTTFQYPFIATYDSNNNLNELRMFTELGYEGAFDDIIIGPDEQIIGVGTIYKTDYYSPFLFISTANNKQSFSLNLSEIKNQISPNSKEYLNGPTSIIYDN